MTVRIGVVADTHCPEFAKRLPDGLFAALQGVDLVLHAGDVNGQSTLDALAAIAPVHAVRGDHDAGLTSLPLSRELEIEGRRVVVVHGNRSRWIEEPETFLWTITLGFYRPHRRLPMQLARRHPEADVIVFGHTHRAETLRVGRQLVFNPGGVYQWNRDTTRARLQQRPGWFEWCWLQVARHIRRTPPPTVGILELGPDGARTEIISL
jgi:hypothetical protein